LADVLIFIFFSGPNQPNGADTEDGEDATREVTLKWESTPKDGNEIDGYLIEWEAGSDGEKLEDDFVQHKNDKMSYSKNKTLTSGELYTITITANNSAGEASSITSHRARKFCNRLTNLKINVQNFQYWKVAILYV